MNKTINVNIALNIAPQFQKVLTVPHNPPAKPERSDAGAGRRRFGCSGSIVTCGAERQSTDGEINHNDEQNLRSRRDHAQNHPDKSYVPLPA